jgi:hypothetical protein
MKRCTVRRFLRAWTIGFLLIGALGWPSQAGALTVLPVSIAEMTDKAELIFNGICTAVEPGRVTLPNSTVTVPTTKITFGTITWLKGSEPDPFSFQQWANKELPVYEVGKEYTVFLSKESKIGVRTTIGLGQGKFTTIQGADGQLMTANEDGNKSLFVGVPATRAMTKALSTGGVEPGQPGGPINRDRFFEMIRQLSVPEQKTLQLNNTKSRTK